MIPTFIQAIATACRINISRFEKAHGGDINECYCLHGDGIKYFLKLNAASRLPGMFKMESDGLDALRNNSSLIVPELIQQGITNNRQWLLLQWIEKGLPGKNSLENFGAALAMMHYRPQPYFGWHNSNYIGRLQQVNTQKNDWNEFYAECRIVPLVKILFDNGSFSKTDIDNAKKFCRQIVDLFPSEPPALVHGDLWSGNYMITNHGKAAIFDPAVYCGHREMDVGMTKLFGGFTQPFYDAYHETYPLEKGWRQRLPLAQLYPLLVHAVLFDGQYIESARQIIKKFH